MTARATVRAETLSAPGGVDLFVCPKCFESFVALFLLNKHVREKHPDSKKGLCR